MSQSTSNSEINLQKVLLEIEEEVRAKRASGELPADVERELDQAFAHFAPPGAFDSDFESLVARAERHSYIDLLAPNESVRPGVPHVKRLVQKTVRWYLRYVADQFSAFANLLSNAVKVLGRRVEELEAQQAPDELVPVVLGALRQRAAQRSAEITAKFKDVKGRVLVTSCGAGDLVQGLVDAKVDAYGVDIASDLIASGGSLGLDLRANDELEHLQALNPGVLDGILMSGFVDLARPRQQVELVNLAAVVLKENAQLVIIATDPLRWEMLDEVPTDLVSGKPLRPTTWTYLLNDRGFKNVSITPSNDGDNYLISATR